ncbi:hypothetical protein ILUMI_08324 [Ignelater luminosus]|uniref:Uncharacterized protein n=1 Tax=Ignelater luminosus TaxID=2038154 RepID=A0A8K0GH53_IGNLU|nr:hypothetical protein ILUMI_08324 [Ignelater luminosus]
MPKQQSGNTNDGNTARKFFRNAEKSAEITGVNVKLIKRFYIILESINCGFPINLDQSEKYAQKTRDLYLKEYSWYSMPVTVTVQAQEARNKNNRKYRELGKHQE